MDVKSSEITRPVIVCPWLQGNFTQIFVPVCLHVHMQLLFIPVGLLALAMTVPLQNSLRVISSLELSGPLETPVMVTI